MLRDPMAAPSYHLLRLIGRGAVAEVFEAIAHGDSGFRRRVAIKRLVAADPELSTAFIDEARVLGAIHHQNVISILGVGSVEGTLFQALELIDGLDLTALRDCLDERALELPIELCLYVASEVAKALDVVHRAKDPDGAGLGIVHRDVTPRNVMLSWEGEVKLIDFGLCFAQRRMTRTRAGYTKGTPAFMSPEQAAGAALDGRADLYSLGCVLRYLVGPTRAARAPVREILGTLMAHDRAHRPADADQAARLLLEPMPRADQGRALRAFLAPLAPTQVPRPKEIAQLAGLFDFEPSGSSEGEVAGYTKTTRPLPVPSEAADTQPWPTQPSAPRAASAKRTSWLVSALWLMLLVATALTTLLVLRAPPRASVAIAPRVAARAALTSTVQVRERQPEPEPERVSELELVPAQRPQRSPLKPRSTRRVEADAVPERVESTSAVDAERLAALLHRAGLRAEDIAPSLRARWDAAAGSGALDAMQALWPELEAEVASRRRSTPVMRRRIAATGEKLRGSTGSAPAATIEALERTYFDLRKRVGEPLTEPEASRCLADLDAWERAVRSLP